MQSINEELQTLNNELKLKLDAVSRAHNDLQNLMGSSDVATLFLSTNLRINRFTPPLANIFSVTAGDEGRPIADFTHRLEYGELAADARQVLANLAPLERTIRSQEGRWFLMRMRPYRTLDDKIEGVVVTFVDVTERQEAEGKWESRQKLLLSELSHRVKNSLAIVQAIVTDSLPSRGVGQEAQEALSSRLHAVTKSHDLLVRNEWNGSDLMALAREQLAGRRGQEPSRVRLEGPAVHLSSDQATPLALLLYELETKATKYGALSKPGGRVAISWETIQADRGQRLRLVWTETGGPRLNPPKTNGFGSYLIEHGLLEAKIARDFRPEGLVCTIELPIQPLERGSRD